MKWPCRSKTRCNPPYQRNISIDEYEIILMDNGSAKMLDEGTQKISPNLNYVYLSPDEASPSPAAAINRGVALSRAPVLCLMIDGARLLTPGSFYLFHDYNTSREGTAEYGVYTAVTDALDDSQFEFCGIYGCCGLFRRREA